MPLVYFKSLSCHTSKQKLKLPFTTLDSLTPRGHKSCSNMSTAVPCQGANSSFHMQLVPSFLGDRKPETSQEPSVCKCQKSAPLEISLVTELTPGHMWVSVCSLPAHISVKTCAALWLKGPWGHSLMLSMS